MNKYENLGFFDFEDFVEELNEEQLFCVNGGACGSGGSSIRNPGSCGSGGSSYGTPTVSTSSSTTSSSSSNNTSTSTSSSSTTSSSSSNNTSTSASSSWFFTSFIKRFFSGSCAGGGAVTSSYQTTQPSKCNGGSPSPVERYTKQDYWVSKFGSEFSKSACAATSILNELSEQYYNETGKLLTDYQKDQAMRNAVDSGCINYKDAYVNDWSVAASKMAESLGLKGTYKNTYEEEKADAKIYAWDKDKNGTVDHFVNDIGNGYYFDPYTGNIGLVSNLSLQKGRETRLLDYTN